MDLLLQETALLLKQTRLLLKLVSEGVFCHLEVVFDHHKWVLQLVLQYLHFLFNEDEFLLGFSVGSPSLNNRLFKVTLSYESLTILFFMGSSLIILLYNYKNKCRQSCPYECPSVMRAKIHCF